MYRKIFLQIVMMFFMAPSIWAKTNMLFYCGTTMVPAMQTLIKAFEKNRNCTIKIIQGGSGQLLRTLKLSRNGDLFLPGSETYYCDEPKRLFPYRKTIGRNRIVLLVHRGNPLKIHTLEDLFDKKVPFAVGNPQLGSVGKASEEMISKSHGPLYWKRMELWAVLFGADSRDLNNLMFSEGVAVTLNWEAAVYHGNERQRLSIVSLPESKSCQKKLVLSTIIFSKHPKLARAFVDFAASPAGQKILQQYGLSDE